MNNNLSKEIFESNVAAGWWDLNNPRPDGVTLSLIHSEISEAWKGLKSGLADEHLPQHKNWLVELADAAIRIYDFAGFKGWDLEEAFNDGDYPVGIDFDSGIWWAPQIADLHELVSDCVECVRKNRPEAAQYLAVALAGIYTLVGTDRLNEVIADKRAYNAQRADHKPENRAKADGKKF